MFAASFAFFLAETIANVLVYGLAGDEHSYVRRDPMNVLNLLLLVVELLWFTPLSGNWVFARIAKLKVLRCCFLVHLRYKHNWQMKVIFRSFFKAVPLILSGNMLMALIFLYFMLILNKAYKDDGYYCDNIGLQVAGKQDCFNWGGDWVKDPIDLSSFVASLSFSLFSCTMEGWMYLMIRVMNMSGQDQAPS